MFTLPKCANGCGTAWLLAAALLGACARDARNADGAPDNGANQAAASPPSAAGEAADDKAAFGSMRLTAADGPSQRAAAELETAEVDDFQAQCAHDRRGNWVCIWPVSSAGAAGPCAFGPDGTVHVASRSVAADARERQTPQTARLTRFRSQGEPVWSRTWQRDLARGSGVDINALVVAANGTVYWGGEDCDPEARRPAAAPAQGYFDSCLDARLVALDANGETAWDWSFGSAGGLDRISDLALARDGLYLAGAFHPPLVVPQQPTISGAGGQDLYLMHLVNPGQVNWVHTWGTPEHEANDLRIAAAPLGDVAVTGHLGTEVTTPGFYARLSAEGVTRWQQADGATYIANLALANDDAVYSATAGLRRFDALGARSELPGVNGLGIAKIRATDHGSLVVSSQDGDQLEERDLHGKLLRRFAFAGPKAFWYESGLCVQDGQVAISSTISEPSDFGLFEAPLAIAERSAFLLLLRQW